MSGPSTSRNPSRRVALHIDRCAQDGAARAGPETLWSGATCGPLVGRACKVPTGMQGYVKNQLGKLLCLPATPVALFPKAIGSA